MTSVVNGTAGVSRNGPPPVSSGNSNSGDNSSASNANPLTVSANSTTATSFSSFLDNDFIDLLPHSTWELEPQWVEARPDSRQSVTPVSTPTPRPPSQPAYSPATTVAQSPLQHFVGQQSPSVPNPTTPAPSYSAAFTFSPLGGESLGFPSMDAAGTPNSETKDSKANVMEEAQSMMEDSGRLRTLLMKPPNSVESAEGGETKNRILIGLLNHQDDEEGRQDNRSSPRGSRASMAAGPSDLAKPSAPGANILLQKVNSRYLQISKRFPVKRIIHCRMTSHLIHFLV